MDQELAKDWLNNAVNHIITNAQYTEVSKRDIADQLEVNYSHFTLVLNGGRNVSNKLIQLLSTQYGISFDGSSSTVHSSITGNNEELTTGQVIVVVNRLTAQGKLISSTSYVE